MNCVLVIQNEADAGLGQFCGRLEAAGFEVRLVGAGVADAMPAGLNGVCGLIMLGGSPAPDDDARAPWLPQARRLVAESVERRIPYFGVCLGAQVLAVVAGGRVAPADTPELGLVTLSRTDAALNDPVFSALPLSFSAVEWHFDEITRLPPNAQSAATSPACSNQAFRVGEYAWGVQFHPELLANGFAAWADAAPHAFARTRSEPIVLGRHISDAEAELQRTGGSLFDRWIAIVKQQLTPV
ncbi:MULTISPECIES: type 1 glutamine amidotransferase [unclassified Leucobacter]|uniref:type 1 glutamine amidotransferase n=1 Tax=unclassified Leucobacter TaxID=2621730 RepID=UPI00301850D2